MNNIFIPQQIHTLLSEGKQTELAIADIANNLLS